jgi:hypothetical protein
MFWKNQGVLFDALIVLVDAMAGEQSVHWFRAEGADEDPNQRGHADTYEQRLQK